MGNLLRDLLTNFVWAKYMVVQVHKFTGYTSSISGSGFLRWDLGIGLVKRNCIVKFVWQICMVDLLGKFVSEIC
jgi:hypothetical protein